MTNLAYPIAGGMPASNLLHCVVGMLVLALLSPLARGAGDPYLGMLEKEVTKVEGAATDNLTSSTGMQTGSTGADAAELASSREHFEQSLRQKYVGTYSFYRRLPQRSREEVFVDFRDGAPMEALRGKIIDRFLHP